MTEREKMGKWMKVLTPDKLRQMTDEEYKASVLKKVSSSLSSLVESEESVFDDDDINLLKRNVAFNGLVDGAGEFPLWEDDSRK